MVFITTESEGISIVEKKITINMKWFTEQIFESEVISN